MTDVIARYVMWATERPILAMAMWLATLIVLVFVVYTLWSWTAAVIVGVISILYQIVLIVVVRRAASTGPDGR